jgi:uncharacterized membrane protein
MKIFLFAMLVLTGLLFHWIPFWSRRDIFFAVTVRPDFRSSDEARGILFRYRRAVWLATAAGCVCLLLPVKVLVVALAPIIQAVVAMSAWSSAHKEAMPFRTAPPTIVSASLEPRDTRFPVSVPALAGPFLMMAAAAFALLWNWDKVPDRFPVHWGIDGLPDRWTTRSFRSAYMPLSVGFITALLTTVMMFFIRNYTRREAGSVEEAERQTRLRDGTVRIMLFSNYFIAALFSYFGVRPILEGGSRMNLAIFLPLLLGGNVVLVIASIRLGAVSSSAPSSLQTVFGDHTEDACWKWGQIYVNRNDPALLVEKRFGIGYTLNFGHWQAWALMALIAAGPLVVIWLS